MICKNCGKEVLKNYQVCPHCHAETIQENIVSDIYRTIPPDFTISPQEEEKQDNDREKERSEVSETPKETLPPVLIRKKKLPELKPPLSPPPESFFRIDSDS
jgi:predicted ATP-dependent serine protease